MNGVANGWWALAAVGGLALAGCQPAAKKEPPLEHHQGTLTSGCAPNDTVSRVLELESVTRSSQVFFSLWPASSAPIPGQVRFDVNRPVGRATYCVGPEACQLAQWGEVRFSGSTAEGAVHGDWKLGMRDGSQFQGSFEADWRAIQAICG